MNTDLHCQLIAAGSSEAFRRIQGMYVTTLKQKPNPGWAILPCRCMNYVETSLITGIVVPVVIKKTTGSRSGWSHGVSFGYEPTICCVGPE